MKNISKKIFFRNMLRKDYRHHYHYIVITLVAITLMPSAAVRKLDHALPLSRMFLQKIIIVFEVGNAEKCYRVEHCYLWSETWKLRKINT